MLKQSQANLVNGYVVYDFGSNDPVYEVEMKYWDKDVFQTYKELAATNINCQFVPMHLYKQKMNSKIARFAILD